MTTIHYVDLKGQRREYPQSFGLDTLEELAELVLSRGHATMIEVADSTQDLADETIVRHDVDHSIDHALAFARWEAERGIRASYFILHTAWYFQNDFENTMSKCREMKRMGHEVGLHHNTLTVAHKFGGNGEAGKMAAYFMRSVLTQMAAAEVACRGAAAHASEVGADNLKFWECYPLSDFGLRYEAYQMHDELNANYISDNRGVLRAPLAHVDGKPTHLLVHPEHWQLS